LLQFGHGDEAVEDGRVFEDLARGNVLQFGHGDEAVEDLLQHGVQRNVVCSLQFGHGDEAVEDVS